MDETASSRFPPVESTLMTAAHVRLEGSGRAPKQGAVRIGDVNAASAIDVTVTLGESRRSPDDFGTVKRTLARFGLTVQAEYPATGSLIMRGTAARVEDAFDAGLGMYSHGEDGLLRGREGDVHVPSELDGIVSGVFGLDQRRVARRLDRGAAAKGPGGAAANPLGPAELEQRYRFPGGDGAGQTIAIAEFGGGYFPDDVRAFCKAYGRPAPEVDTVSVGYKPMTPGEIAALSAEQQGPALGESHEVMMDVEIVAGLCPGARIKVFFAPFDQKGWIDLFDAVLAADPAPMTLCVSWGLAEDSPDWSAAAMEAINERLRTASSRGITVCAATGDDGSGDQMHDANAHVHFPASSPFVLAVGGTMLEGGEEVVWWNAPGDRSQHGGGSTGGGVSVKFPRPKWQDVRVTSHNDGGTDGRVVPDVAALAGAPGYSLVFDGQPTMNGGTSAAAPLWAALIARIAAQASRHQPQFLTPLLYAEHRAGTGFTDITRGHNASPQPGFGYDAQPGFDAVSGWGVPNGEALLALL
jgi:kumamolisin